MSKLADRIRSATRQQQQQIGFGATTTAREPTMVLVGMARDARDANELVRRGADAVVLGSAKSPAPPDALLGVDGVLAGAFIEGSADRDAKAYREAGFDFVVFDPDRASATAVLDEQAGYVLTMPRDLGDNEVRTLEAFQLDAIDVGVLGDAITVRQQIELRRIYAMTRKPLMAGVNSAIPVAELQALRDANVIVVAVAGAENVERLRRTIDALPPRPRSRDGSDRSSPLLPRTAVVEEEEDEHTHE